MITKAMAVVGLLRAYRMLHEEDVLTELTIDEGRSIVIEMLIDVVTGDAAFQSVEELVELPEAAE